MLRKVLLTHSTPLSVNLERVKRVEGLILVTSLFVFGMSKLSPAMMCGEHSSGQQPAEAQREYEDDTREAVTEAVSAEAVDVGNKICPVSGEKIDEKLKATYEYEGKIYNFCCPMCREEFNKDPEKYIKKVEEELEAEAKEKREEKEQTPVGMHQGYHH